MQDKQTGQIIAYQVGNRSSATAQKLWDKIPESIRKNGLFYTDDWVSYKTVIPKKQHLHNKHKKDTNHIERFNNTLRHGCSRLVRQNLTFSKSLKNHILVIKYFICHYNLWCQSKFENLDPSL
jgi:IS1 family transposase